MPVTYVYRHASLREKDEDAPAGHDRSPRLQTYFKQSRPGRPRTVDLVGRAARPAARARHTGVPGTLPGTPTHPAIAAAAAAAEAAQQGGTVLVVEGKRDNIKLTVPEDYMMLAAAVHSVFGEKGNHVQ